MCRDVHVLGERALEAGLPTDELSLAKVLGIELQQSTYCGERLEGRVNNDILSVTCSTTLSHLLTQ